MKNMTNSGLDRIRVIKRAQLSDELYFQSLLEQAHGKGLLGDNDIERLQYECLALLADKTERYNSGGSSSIRVEKAQSIMTSNMFTIGLWLKTYPNPDDAVTALLNEPISEIYRKGRKRIDTMYRAAKTIHKKLLGQLIETKNEFYRLTAEDAINGFFKLYYADFAAQEIHITADYPIYNPIPKLAGIEFIIAYLNALYCENRFCGYFSAEDIHHLLCGYAEDYQDLLINIYEPVLTAAIGCVIVGTDALRLNISDNGMAYIVRLFLEMSPGEIMQTVQKAAGELTRCLQCPNSLAGYIQNSLPLIANRIETATRSHTLDRVFLAPTYPESKTTIIFSYGEKMADEQYRKLIDEIGQCRYSQDKMAIIKEYIHSLADLEDVLLDADLTQEETHSVLSGLGLPEMAALLKKYPLMPHIDMIDFREQEQQLRNNLHEFISKLPQEQQSMVVKISEATTEE
jgi:hypothetical protein